MLLINIQQYKSACKQCGDFIPFKRDHKIIGKPVLLLIFFFVYSPDQILNYDF